MLGWNYQHSDHLARGTLERNGPTVLAQGRPDAVSSPYCAVISQTTPQPPPQPWPPPNVVPHRLPAASRVTGPSGSLPSLPSKSCRSVSVHVPLDLVSLKTN